MNIQQQLAKRDHVIQGGADRLAVDKQAARFLVATRLICAQDDVRDENHYHIVDGHTWAEVELAVSEFNGRAPAQRTAEAAISEVATYAFWSRIAAAFPEMASGDAQIADEDTGAFYLWLTGTSKGYPSAPIGVAPADVPRDRIATALADAMDAGGQVLKTLNPALPPAPAAVASALQGCVNHLLQWNLPVVRA